MTILSIGEILWDVIGQKEHLGGAPFNFAVNATRFGHAVLFVSAVGDDERGRCAAQQSCERGVPTTYIKTVSNAPTGIASVELDAERQPSFRVQRPAAYDRVSLTQREITGITGLQPDWIYFGTLHQVYEAPRRLTKQLIDNNPAARRFYDVNLRPGSYTPALVEELASQTDIAKLNQEEAGNFARWFDLPADSTELFCRRAAARFGWQAVAVTRGADGCGMLIADDYCEVPGIRVEVADAVGAGDAFAAAFLHGLTADWNVRRIAAFANQLGAIVASRRGATPAWTLNEVQAVPTE